MYNQHQSGPFPSHIFVPPFDDPMNPDIPAEVIRGVNLVGDAITRRLDVENKVGAVSRMGFDAWWNGGMRTAPCYHNIVGILTEAALFDYATNGYYPTKSLPKSFANGLSAKEPSIFYPSPWQGGSVSGASFGDSRRIRSHCCLIPWCCRREIRVLK